MDDISIENYIASLNNVNPKEMFEWVEQNGKKRLIKTIFSPNEHLSGTYLFPDSKIFNIILEVSNTWFSTNRSIDQFCKDLIQDKNYKVQNAEIILALIP